MIFTPYSTAVPFFGAPESWIPLEHQQRRQAYQLYESMYWNVPETFKLVQRGTDAKPIYLPSPRTIVEATNRFLAKDWDYAINPRVGTPEQRTSVGLMLQSLFKREQMWSKFATQRRFGLIRGDAIWHIVGNPLKEPGARLSIYEVDPASYFPIYDDEDEQDPSRRIGCHLVDTYEYEEEIVTRRLTYRKDPENPLIITRELALFEQGKWWDGDPDAEIVRVKQILPPEPLPPQITQLPVYHVKNFRTPADPFGSSEIRGFETIVAAMNQTISDEDLAIALEGLGMYATDSGPPVDADGNETNWALGPGKVVELSEGSKMNRIDGISGLPGLEHIKFMKGEMMEAAGVPKIATGAVDVQVAESGVALYMHLSPLLAKNAEKEGEMLGVMDHFLYDITHMWLPAYEQFSDGMETEVASVVGDPMPQNRKAQIDEIIKLATSNPPIISAAYARVKLTELGYEFPEEMGEEIVAETTARAQATAFDPFTNRVNQELELG